MFIKNNLMQKIKYLILILLSLSQFSLGQKSSSNASFISLYIGDLSIISENITKYYDSKNDLTFGVGIGIPISNSLSIDASVSYYKKSSHFPEAIDISSIESAVLKQLIFNAGLNFQLIPNRIVGFSFLFGVNYASIDEERKSSDGRFIHQIEGAGNTGIYGGANIELSLGRGPMAIFGNAKYTYSWEPFLEFEDTYRELRYTAGVKFYLASRWK